MILTVGNTKGGVGKTTLAVNIAIARALTGRRVWLVDGDGQGTAQTAITIRADADHQPGIACSSYPHGPALRSQVQCQGSLYDDIIIDAGGRDSTALRAALVLSDVLLVPFQPRSYDVWALNDIAELIKGSFKDIYDIIGDDEKLMDFFPDVFAFRCYWTASREHFKRKDGRKQSFVPITGSVGSTFLDPEVSGLRISQR